MTSVKISKFLNELYLKYSQLSICSVQWLSFYFIFTAGNENQKNKNTVSIEIGKIIFNQIYKVGVAVRAVIIIKLCTKLKTLLLFILMCKITNRFFI